MLIEFRVENHRSVANEQVLTFATGRAVGELGEPLREVPGSPAPLATVAAIFGANASGKTNVLDALLWMRHAIVSSQAQWLPDGGVPRQPFAWSGWGAKPTRFEATFLLDGARYRYSFEVDDTVVVSEKLEAWPRGRKQTWVAREGERFRFGELLLGENRVVQGVTRPNALFLSAAAQLRHPQLTPIWRWFADAHPSSWLVRRRWQAAPTAQWLAGMLEAQPALFPLAGQLSDPRSAVLSILRQADMDIADIRVEAEEAAPGRRRHRVFVRHEPAAEAWLPIEDESAGTQAFIQLLPGLFESIGQGRLMVLDELDASLHPKLTRAIVRAFQSRATNSRGAQLVCTTHDTSLMGTLLGDPVLRREEIWFTEKQPSGATEITPCTAFPVRKEENIERGYVQGRYGASPLVGPLAPTAT